MARKTSESKEILKQLLELLKKKDREEPKDNVRHKAFLVPRNDHVKVYVRMSIIRVGEIDAVRQEFHCEFYMRLRWEEVSLKKNTIDKENIDWDSMWNPSYYFINAVNIEDHERNRSIRRGNPPQVILQCRIIGTFKEVLEIDKFPFDYQDLSLTLTSKCHADKLTFVKDPEVEDNICTEYFYPKQEWDLRPHVITKQQTLEPKEGASLNRYPQYRICMNVMRQFKFYIYNLFLVMGLITALTFSSLAVEADAPGDRVQITLTLLLTSVAFKYYAQQFVPTVSYLTLIDKYILSCIVFQFCMALYTTFSSFLSSSDMLPAIELTCFGVALLCFVLIHVYFAIISLEYIKEAKNKMKRHREKYMKRNPKQMEYTLKEI